MTSPSSRRIGLVLGAGGTVGCAYHAGALFSLEHHLGWDPRGAAVVVGTSAGSVVGALLRVGLSSDDLVALFTEVDPMPDRHRLVTGLRQPLAAQRMTTWHALGRLRPPTPFGMARSAVRRSMTPMMLSMARPGRHQLAESAAGLAELAGGAWPEDPLFVVTTAMPNGRRHVLTKHTGIPLPDAVRASCAVPGLIEPVRHEGVTYVDGGVHSTTNVDVMPHDIDELWVIAPMAGSPRRWTPETMWRRLVDRQLRAELGTLPPKLPVRVFTPGEDSMRVMGLDLMAGDRGTPTVREAFLETGDRLAARPEDADAVAQPTE